MDLTTAQVRACQADIDKNELYSEFVNDKSKLIALQLKREQLQIRKEELAYKKLKLEYNMLKIELEDRAGQLSDKLKLEKMALALQKDD